MSCASGVTGESGGEGREEEGCWGREEKCGYDQEAARVPDLGQYFKVYILTVCFLQDTVSLAAAFYAHQKRLVPLASMQESS